MKTAASKLCFGHILLLASIVATTALAAWLYQENVDERLHRVFNEHDKLILLGQHEEARQLLVSEIAAENDDGPLDPIWLPLIRASGNGYVQLGYLVRVLRFNPDREATYKEISNLVETAPEPFHSEVKPRLLADIQSIEGIRQDHLSSYDLLE